MISVTIRWALEVARNALHDAGLPQEGVVTGVFVGAWDSKSSSHDDSVYALAGSSDTMLANRISFTFDLRGPSLLIDTACSSSLVALDAACSAILKGQCDAALVIGVNIKRAETTKLLTRAGFLSETGRCHALDARANG